MHNAELHDIARHLWQPYKNLALDQFQQTSQITSWTMESSKVINYVYRNTKFETSINFSKILSPNINVQSVGICILFLNSPYKYIVILC